MAEVSLQNISKIYDDVDKKSAAEKKQLMIFRLS